MSENWPPYKEPTPAIKTSFQSLNPSPSRDPSSGRRWLSHSKLFRPHTCRDSIAIASLVFSQAIVLGWMIFTHDLELGLVLMFCCGCMFLSAVLSLVAGCLETQIGLTGLDPITNAKKALFRDSVQTGHTHIECLDGLRGLAVTWVILFHCTCTPSPWFTQPLSNFNAFVGSPMMQLALSGSMGVDLFFMLSGFLIATMLAREARERENREKLAPVFGKFVLGRWFRLVPAYAVLLVFAAYISPDPTARSTCQRYWWVNLLFVNNYFDFWFGNPSAGEPAVAWGGCEMHTWTIAVEFQFYIFSIPLLWALVTVERRLKQRRGGSRALQVQLTLLGILFLVTIALRVFLRVEFDGKVAYINNFFYTRAGSYLAGMGASLIVLRPSELKKQPHQAYNSRPPSFTPPGSKPRKEHKPSVVPEDYEGEEEQKEGEQEGAAVGERKGRQVTASLRESYQHLNESFLGLEPKPPKPRTPCSPMNWLKVFCIGLAALQACYLGPGDFVDAFDAKPSLLVPATPLRAGPPWTWLDVQGKYNLSYACKVVCCAFLGLFSALQVVEMLQGRADRLNKVLSWPVWVPFARVSYSAYLFQFFFIQATYEKWCIIGVEDSYWVCFGLLVKLFAIVMLVTNCAALWMHVLVEAPCNNVRPLILACLQRNCCCCCKTRSRLVKDNLPLTHGSIHVSEFTENGPRMTFSTSTLYHNLQKHLLNPSESSGTDATDATTVFSGFSGYSPASSAGLLSPYASSGKGPTSIN